MQTLVTGGAGFIGSNLCDRLISDGHDVICLDNLSSGSQKNIEHLLGHPHFRFINHDITLPLDPNQIANPDVIFHFACPASPNPASPIAYINHPVETLRVSSQGTDNMLELAKRTNAQIILASTSEVYGDPLVHPQPESYWGNVSPNGVRSCYDEGKRYMEALAYAHLRTNQTKIKIIRIFNTYGPRLRRDDGRFVINLINAYLDHTPLKVYGDGSVTRSFGYIDDLIEGIMRVMDSDQMVGEVVNLGNPVELSLSQAIKIFEQVVGTTLEKSILPAQPDDPQKRQPDITKAQKILGWEPRVDWSSGIKKTLEYYQSNL